MGRANELGEIPQLSHFQDYKVLAALFDTGVAGLSAQGSNCKLPPEFKYLRIANSTIPSSSADFDFNNGILLDYTAPADRLVDDKLAEKFNSIEKETIGNLAQAITDLQASQLSNTEKHWSKMCRLREAETQLEKRIVCAYDGNHYASVFNNLGQLKRLQYDLMVQTGKDQEDEDLNLTKIDQIESEIFSCLKKCVSLALPKSLKEGSWQAPNVIDDPNFSLPPRVYKVSVFQAKILASAYAQMSSLLLKRAARIARLLANTKSSIAFDAPQLKGLQQEKMQLETHASEFSMISGAFGNSFAAENAVAMNPYAKLCGNMVKDSLLNGIRWD